MKGYIVPTLITAFVAEIVTSWWVWTSWPFDSLDLLYRGSFWVYESERLLPWIVIATLVSLIRFLLIRRKNRRLIDQDAIGPLPSGDGHNAASR